MEPLARVPQHGHCRFMETLTVNGSIFLIGLASVLTGVVALRLPAGRRLEAILALVVGAGVGVAFLAIGSAFARSEVQREQAAFFVASVAGFVGVVVCLAAIRRRET
jgi:uncharacterized membrane-anchored protein